MPPKKKKSETLAINADVVHKLWTTLTIDDWLDVLRKFASDKDFKQKGKGDLWGRCLNHSHSEATSSFHIQPEKGYAKCFGCDMFETDPIRVVALAMGKAYADAFTYIVTTYSPPGLAASLVKDAQDYARRNEMKNHILTMLNRELVDAASSGRTLPEFAYAQPLVNYLESRKIDTGLLHTMPIGIVPPMGRLWARLGELEKSTGKRFHDEVQDYLKDVIPLGGVTKGACEGWMLFANHTTPGQIGLFRVRNHADKSIIVIREPKNDSAQLGFFGLGATKYATVIGRTDLAQSKTCVVVEGEFDALACLQEQVIRGDMRQVVVAASGNNNHNLDALESCAFEEVRILGDNDGGGDTFNRSHLKDTNLKARVFSWPSLLHGVKDLHDVWAAFGGDVLLNEVTKDENYLFPATWATELLAREIATYSPDDAGGRSRVAMNIGHLLKDRAEQSKYIDLAAKMLGVDVGELRKHLASVDSDEGFVTLLAEHLKREYLFLFQEPTRAGVVITAWHRRKNKITTFDLAKKNTIEAALQSDLGKLVDWVETHIGVLGRLKPRYDDTMDKLVEGKNLDVRYQEYLKLLITHAVPELVHDLPSRSSLKVVGQGIHYKETNSSNQREFYAVNGPCFLKGTVRNDGGMQWQQVEGPIDDNLYVEQNDKKWSWSKTFGSAEDINSAPPVNIQQTFQDAKKMLYTGWKFESHALECTYLAGMVMAVALGDVFDALPWIYVNAKYQTGKSTLLLNALSNTNKTSTINLLEASVGTDVFSEAGVRQRMNGSTLMLILDEFEVGYGDRMNALDKHQRQARDILSTMRGAQANQGATVTLGTVAGQSVEFHLRFAFAVAGITSTVVKADVSRFNFIYLDSSIGKNRGTTPQQEIYKVFSRAQIDQLRKNITMFALQNADRVRQEYVKVKEEFAASNFFDPRTETRLKEGLLPVITILKMAGVDYKKFVTEYTRVKADKLEEAGSPHEYDNVWQLILQTPGIQVPGEDYREQKFTIGQLLAVPETRGLVSLTNTGLYYIEDKDLLVVNWATATKSIFFSKSHLRGAEPKVMRGMLQDDKRVWPPLRVVSEGISGEIHMHMGLKKPENVCSVIPVSELIGTAARPRPNAINDEEEINKGPVDPLTEVGVESAAGIKDSF